MTSRLILRPLLTIMNGDLSTYMDHEIWSWFPFGRLARGFVKSVQNPYYTVDRFTGIPLAGVNTHTADIEAMAESYTHPAGTYIK